MSGARGWRILAGASREQAPMVSLFWINYNSIHVIEYVKRSLDKLLALDYPNYEVIVVDNGSTDGSREILEEHLRAVARSQEVRFVKLSRNFGFTGGANIAYRLRDRGSKYVGIVNNDAIPRSDYLKHLVDFMEKHDDVGAVQGIVLRMNSFRIDSAGGFVDDELRVYFPFVGKHAKIIHKPIYVSYVEGTMPLYRVEAIKRALGEDNSMYVSAGFLYYLEDVFLSLMLWNHNYKNVVVPVIAGEHYRSATLKKYRTQIRLDYYRLRNRLALLHMTNSRGKVKAILRILRGIYLSKAGFKERGNRLKALFDALRLGEQLRRKYGVINLYKAPLWRAGLKETTLSWLTLK